MDLHLRIFYLRSQHDPPLSQKKVSQDLGVRQATISNIERGITKPNLQIIEKICRYYDCTPTWLLHPNFTPKIEKWSEVKYADGGKGVKDLQQELERELNFNRMRRAGIDKNPFHPDQEKPVEHAQKGSEEDGEWVMTEKGARFKKKAKKSTTKKKKTPSKPKRTTTKRTTTKKTGAKKKKKKKKPKKAKKTKKK